MKKPVDPEELLKLLNQIKQLNKDFLDIYLRMVGKNYDDPEVKEIIKSFKR